MPCNTIHLAIAKEYCKLHPEENINEFYLGSNLPDATSNKTLTHYGTNNKKMLFLDYAKTKVDLNIVVKFVDLNNSINRGIFLHLLSDYVFFNDKKLKLDKERLKSMHLCETSPLSDADANLLTEKLINKYGIDLKYIPPILKQYIKEPIYDHFVFYDEEEIYRYIDRMSKIDLQKVYEDIQNGKIDFYDIEY